MNQAPARPDASTPAHERVYRALRNSILWGELAPGVALTLRGIASQHGVSMTPARDAVRRLSAEGALSISVTGRVSTPELSSERLQELASIRALLEPELAARALPRVHMALIERLDGINHRSAETIVTGDANGYVRTNLEFHRTLYLRAQSPAMLALAESVWLKSGPTLRALYARRQRSNASTHHQRLLRALRERDEPGLRKAVRADVTQALRMLSG